MRRRLILRLRCYSCRKRNAPKINLCADAVRIPQRVGCIYVRSRQVSMNGHQRYINNVTNSQLETSRET
eukprot:5611244-Prymnesium_polylepis.2